MTNELWEIFLLEKFENYDYDEVLFHADDGTGIWQIWDRKALDNVSKDFADVKQIYCKW